MADSICKAPQSPREVSTRHFLQSHPDMNEAISLSTTPTESYQVYTCNKEGKFVLKTPEAKLQDITLNGDIKSGLKGTHTFTTSMMCAEKLPIWIVENESGQEIGSITAKPILQAKQKGAVPFFELEVVTATGIFAGVTRVWRVDTVDGLAPQISCNNPEPEKITYGARYLFFKSAPNSSTLSEAGLLSTPSKV